MMEVNLARQKVASSIEECLDNWSKAEELEGYKCDNQHCRASDTTTAVQAFKNAPPFLAIKLNRADYEGKVLTKVAFPTEPIDLARWSSTDNDLRYEACCVIEHNGKM